MCNKDTPEIWTVCCYSQEIWSVINLLIFVAKNSPVTETVTSLIMANERMELYILQTDGKIIFF